MLRKHFLQNLGLAGLSGGLFRLSFLLDEGTNEAFRFVHLTIPVFDRRAVYEGYS